MHRKRTRESEVDSSEERSTKWRKIDTNTDSSTSSVKNLDTTASVFTLLAFDQAKVLPVINKSGGHAPATSVRMQKHIGSKLSLFTEDGERVGKDVPYRKEGRCYYTAYNDRENIRLYASDVSRRRKLHFADGREVPSDASVETLAKGKHLVRLDDGSKVKVFSRMQLYSKNRVSKVISSANANIKVEHESVNEVDTNFGMNDFYFNTLDVEPPVMSNESNDLFAESSVAEYQSSSAFFAPPSQLFDDFLVQDAPEKLNDEFEFNSW